MASLNQWTHEFEQVLGVGDGQGSLVCCNPWGCKESDTIERLSLQSSDQSIGASALTSVPSNEYSGLISFRFDWFNLLAVQGTLKSLLQHHNWKASVLWCSTFFMVQLSHPYMKTI